MDGSIWLADLSSPLSSVVSMGAYNSLLSVGAVGAACYVRGFWGVAGPYRSDATRLDSLVRMIVLSASCALHLAGGLRLRMGVAFESTPPLPHRRVVVVRCRDFQHIAYIISHPCGLQVV